MAANTSGKENGLYENPPKYWVERTDATDEIPGQKHYGCFLFVLDLNHDKAARLTFPILIDNYRKLGFNKLADDLERKMEECEVTGVT